MVFFLSFWLLVGLGTKFFRFLTGRDAALRRPRPKGRNERGKADTLSVA
jgi:hypothetical protein